MGLRTWAAGLLVAALAAGSGSAQQAVRSARLVADVAEDGSADVRVLYELGVPGGPVVVPFELLGFGAATSERFDLEGRAEAVVLEVASGSRRRADVPVAAAGTLALAARYRVERAVARSGGALRGHVPVLVVAWPPEAALPGLFTAELRLPPAWRVTEGFPSGLRAVAEGDRETLAYTVALSVVPAVVSFRGRADGAWRPGLRLILDVLVGGALVAFSAAGWLHLRRVAARAGTVTAAGPG